MTESNRCAIYARISTDKQSTLSPVDQIRKCREYADNHGFVVIPEHVYTDEGVSGVGSDRQHSAICLLPHPLQQGRST